MSSTPKPIGVIIITEIGYLFAKVIDREVLDVRCEDADVLANQPPRGDTPITEHVRARLARKNEYLQSVSRAANTYFTTDGVSSVTHVAIALSALFSERDLPDELLQPFNSLLITTVDNGPPIEQLAMIVSRAVSTLL